MARMEKVFKTTRKAAEIISSAYGRVTLPQLKQILTENKEVKVVTKITEGCFLERQLSPLPKWWGHGFNEDFDTTLTLVSCHMSTVCKLELNSLEHRFISVIKDVINSRKIDIYDLITWDDYNYICKNLALLKFIIDKLEENWKNIFGIRQFIDNCKNIWQRGKHGIGIEFIDSGHYEFIQNIEYHETEHLQELLKDVPDEEKSKVITFISRTGEYLCVLAGSGIDFVWAANHIHLDDAHKIACIKGNYFGEDHDDFWIKNFGFSPNIKYLIFNYLDKEEVLKLDFEKLSKICQYFKGSLRFKHILKFYSLDCAYDLMDNGITADDVNNMFVNER